MTKERMTAKELEREKIEYLIESLIYYSNQYGIYEEIIKMGHESTYYEAEKENMRDNLTETKEKLLDYINQIIEEN